MQYKCNMHQLTTSIIAYLVQYTHLRFHIGFYICSSGISLVGYWFIKYFFINILVTFCSAWPQKSQKQSLLCLKIGIEKCYPTATFSNDRNFLSMHCLSFLRIMLSNNNKHSQTDKISLSKYLYRFLRPLDTKKNVMQQTFSNWENLPI